MFRGKCKGKNVQGKNAREKMSRGKMQGEKCAGENARGKMLRGRRENQSRFFCDGQSAARIVHHRSWLLMQLYFEPGGRGKINKDSLENCMLNAIIFRTRWERKK